MKTSTQILLALVGICAVPAAMGQNDDFDAVEMVAHQVAGSVHYLEGRGGNIGLSIGVDGVVMVDDQFAPLTGKITAAIEALSDQPVRFLINTHVHPDHTGGNENFGNMGVPIVSHDNVRVRLTQGIRGGPPAPVAAWPVLTYGESLTLHLNAEEIEVIKAPPGHTDGDSFVHFKTSDVLHLGDVFRTGAFPVIDTSNGGTASGTIASLQLALEIADENTVILPGHGQPSTAADVREFLNMVMAVEAQVSALIADGMTVEQVVASDPTAAFSDRGLGSPERFINGLYDSLASN